MRGVLSGAVLGAVLLMAGPWAGKPAAALPLPAPIGLNVAAQDVDPVARADYVCRWVWRCGPYGYCGWRRACWWRPGPFYYGYDRPYGFYPYGFYPYGYYRPWRPWGYYHWRRRHGW